MISSCFFERWVNGETYGNMVDPDIVCFVQGDGVSSPDILRVDVGDLNVLQNDVLRSVDNSQAFAFDDTLGAIADDCFVRANGDTKSSSCIVGDARDGRCIWLVVLAPFVLVNGSLASSTSTPYIKERSAVCISQYNCSESTYKEHIPSWFWCLRYRGSRKSWSRQ